MSSINYDDLLQNNFNVNPNSNNAPLLSNKRRRNVNKATRSKTKSPNTTFANQGLCIKDINNKNSNYKIFIAKIKEVIFNTDEKLFIQSRNKNTINQNDDNFSSIPNESFWKQRYYYFSKFDDGIKLDRESWYSVTPEELSEYIAKLCKGDVVIDAFCGSGGNTIHFSKHCHKVYAVDIDEDKIKLCQNNCEVYQCAQNIQFVSSDYLSFNCESKVDCIFLSPPWGGMDYKDAKEYSLKEWVTPDINKIVSKSLSLSENLIFYLPRNTNMDELFSIISETITYQEEEDPTLYTEIQLLRSANKVKAVLVLFGPKFNQITVKDLRKYLQDNYPNADISKVNQLVTEAKSIGVSNFLLKETAYRRKGNPKHNKNYIDDVIKYFRSSSLEDSEDENLDNIHIQEDPKKTGNGSKVLIGADLLSLEQFGSLRSSMI